MPNNKFHRECLEMALQMFGRQYSDLSDNEAKIVSEEVSRRRKPTFWKTVIDFLLR